MEKNKRGLYLRFAKDWNPLGSFSRYVGHSYVAETFLEAQRRPPLIRHIPVSTIHGRVPHTADLQAEIRMIEISNVEIF
jgi:hypothetical protein